MREKGIEKSFRFRNMSILNLKAPLRNSLIYIKKKNYSLMHQSIL